MSNKIIYIRDNAWNKKEVSEMFKSIDKANDKKDALQKILDKYYLDTNNIKADDINSIRDYIGLVTGYRYRRLDTNNKIRIYAFNKGSKGMCYCDACKTKFYNENAYKLFEEKQDKTTYDNTEITCPNCNNTVTGNKVIEPNRVYIVFRKIFINSDDKVALSGSSIQYKWYNGRLLRKQSLARISFNLKTGHSYALPLKVTEYGKTKAVTSIYDCTYGIVSGLISTILDGYHKHLNDECASSIDIYKELYNIIRDYKMKQYNNYIPTFEENFPENEYQYFIDDLKRKRKRINISDICLFNRAPFINPNLTDDLINNIPYSILDTISKSKNRRYQIAKMRKVIKQEDTDIVKTILKYFNVPITKANKRWFRESNYTFIELYSELKDLISIDNIYKLCSLRITYMYGLETMAEFIKTYPEKITTKAINNYCNKLVNFYNKNGFIREYVIRDTFMQLNSICKYKQDYKVNWRLSIDELHDKASSDCKLITNENRSINYDHLEDKEKQFECMYNNETYNLHFALAKDTHELIKVGDDMNICVGSYGTQALEHNCYIVIARDIDTNKPIICIELKKDEDKFKLNQAKLKYNQRADYDDLGKILLQWLKDNKIDYTYCYDMDKLIEQREEEWRTYTEIPIIA